LEKQTRNWLHNSILDKSAFTECIRSLTNNRSPGPDSILVVNELKLLPASSAEFHWNLARHHPQHMLFIIMWARDEKPGIVARDGSHVVGQGRKARDCDQGWESRCGPGMVAMTEGKPLK